MISNLQSKTYTEGIFDYFTRCLYFFLLCFPYFQPSLSVSPLSLLARVHEEETCWGCLLQSSWNFSIKSYRKDTHNIKNTSNNTSTHGSREAGRRYRTASARCSVFDYLFLSLFVYFSLSLCLVLFSIFSISFRPTCPFVPSHPSAFVRPCSSTHVVSQPSRFIPLWSMAMKQIKKKSRRLALIA